MENGSGTLFSINMPLINQFDFKSYYEDITKQKTVVTNDLVAHSLAEQKFGNGQNVGHFLSVFMGTGIGHTYLKNGKPMMITNGICGESGRMILYVHSTLQDSSGIFHYAV